jgi:hypothetical protein
MAERRPNENRYYLALIDALARRHCIDVIDALPEEWAEVDFIKDLETARNFVRDWEAGSGSARDLKSQAFGETCGIPSQLSTC